jgi:hypothetical protein
MANPITINYTATDFDAIKNELINYLRETGTFKDVDFESSNINTLTGLYSWLGANMGFYINAAANEPFLPTAKRYKNLNRIAKLLSYNPRGYRSATIDVIGSLDPEYCLGKEGSYFEIPAYSIFPSNKSTPNGDEFSFTNPYSIIYMVKGFGTRSVQQSDFTYKGFQLPYTAPKSFWTASTSGVRETFTATDIVLNVSDTMPLSVLDRLASTNLRPYDSTNVPIFNPSDSSSVGQPFTRNIETKNTSLTIRKDTTYCIVFTYDAQQAKPYLEIYDETNITEDKKDNIISTIRLMSEDADGNFWTLKEIQNNAKYKFYLGVLGMNNLESVSFEFDKLESTTNGIKQIHMDINKSGDKSELEVLINGQIYSFNQGRISSQIFESNIWDVNQSYYNVNLCILSPDSPDYNYDAKLDVTSKEPGTNEVTIARIFPSYVDQETGTPTVQRTVGQRFGDFQVVPNITVETTEQKTGSVSFSEGINKVFVAFDKPFTPGTSGDVEYAISLTPSQNVQVWYSDKNEDGFSINVEANTGFDGDVNWVATKINTEETREIEVSFNTPIPEIAGQTPDYTIFLTPSDNIRVWFEDKTVNGFKLKAEKSFSGTVSYSTFVFSNDEDVVAETNSSTQKRGTITLGAGSTSKDIVFDKEFTTNEYGLHMIANKNVNVWYTNKTINGFTINIEESDEKVNIDWFADYSDSYDYQKHGMVNFSGQITSAGTLPGLRFTNIPETFAINDLTQGTIKFSFINSNGVIDRANNNLGIKFSADRKSTQEIKFQIEQEDISYSDLRVFVKNSAGDWEEWLNASDMTLSTNIKIGSKVFFSRVEDTKYIEISFGNGVDFGTDPFGNEIIIFGLLTVGQDGNIPPNSLADSIVLSRQILGDDNITLQFEDQFIQLLGLKSSTYFAADERTNTTAIYDSDGTAINSTILSIQQPSSAIGGAFPENTEELRYNAASANLRQDRIVSLDDYSSFVDSAFNDIVLRSKPLSYRELQESGLLPETEIEKYFFNTIFLVILPKSGNEITKRQRDYILETLKENYKSMATVEHELVNAKLIPIDVRVRFRPLKFGNTTSIETSIQKVIRDYFDRNNHELGEELQPSDIVQKVFEEVSGIDYIEIAMNKDEGDKLKKVDYDIDAVTGVNETVAEVKRKKILELLAKDATLLTIVEPLLDVKNSKTNEREWVFSLNIQMNDFEFPILGDIIIELDPGANG